MKLLQEVLLFSFCLCNIVYSQSSSQQEERNQQLRPNITILHEVHENGNENVVNLTKSLSLNKHEVLPLKPIKKKTFNYNEKAKSNKEYKLHPVTFDFNLGDLEDFQQTISNEDADDADVSDELEHFPIDESEQVQIELEPDVNLQNDFPIIPTTTTNINKTWSTTPLPIVVTVSPHIFKILRKKALKKSRELMKHNEDTLKTHADSSLNDLFDIGTAVALNASEEHLNVNIFQLITKLFDHFYWDMASIRRKISTACGLEFQAYLTALHENYAWAQKAFDASGTYRGQLFFGNDKWLGMKPFCYELNHQLHPEERKHFEFQFYTALIRLKLYLPQILDIHLQLGECLPKSCTAEDVQSILSMDPHLQALHSISATLSRGSNDTQVQVLQVRRVPGQYSLWRELKFQIFLSIILLLVGIVCVATWYQAKLTNGQLFEPIPAISSRVEAQTPQVDAKQFELYQLDNKNNNNVLNNNNNNNNNLRDIEANPQDLATVSAANTNEASADQRSFKLENTHNSYAIKQQLGLHEQLLLCFAFQTNSGAILNIDDNKESSTSCVHGMRVLSVLWTIMVHSFLQIFTIGENRYQRVIVERSVWYQFVGNATFSVDTFFFISGFLVTLLFLKQEHKPAEHTPTHIKRSINQTLWIIFYRYVRLTPAYLLVIIFNDLSLRQMVNDSVFLPSVPATSCQRYWWRNILYINNFYPLDEICMIWSWYMANDMQFYIMASILLTISVKHLKLAVLILCSFLLSSWGISGLVSILYHYTHKVALPFESFDFLYDKPWQRVGTYIVGMMTGYVVYKVKTPPKICAKLNWTLWLMSLGLLLLVIFGVWQGQLGIVATAFYVSLGHTAFGLSLVWIVLSCIWGYAPTVNRILSYRAFWPLSRLTYCTYLIHPLIMLILSFHMSGMVHLNIAFVLVIFLGNAVVSFIAAFFISVLFEAPVIRILKICLKK